MPDKIETERLTLRPFEASDAASAFAWLGDPVVMRFTPTGVEKSIAETKARIAGYTDHQKAHSASPQRSGGLLL